jgi:2,4-dienoyl-CoA reductase-like NADH-dependent reductase (Old Yellow Enzyme family)/thioredoxin reductase
MPSFPNLFKPGHIGHMPVKNRIVMPPMVRNYADTKGRVTKKYIDHIVRIASGGVGTMILEASFIAPSGRGFTHQLGIHEDAMIAGLKKLAAAGHSYGAKIGIQLYHAGRQTSQKKTGMKIMAPSAIPDPSSGEMPRVMTIADIKETMMAFADAARRAKAAGLDFVEIHGAHGYLITQFLSPFSNARTDAYGGSDENRFRFLKEVYEAVRMAVGSAYPVTVRLSGDELVKDGIHINDTIEIARRLEKLGADALHISAGNYASYADGKMIPPMASPEGPLVEFAAAVNAAVKIPVIAVAKLGNPKFAEQILKDGKADFVAVGRTLLADPEWPDKLKEGRTAEVMPCISCNQGCISRLFAEEDVWCTVNPRTGRETMSMGKAKRKLKVAVLGGGPAGLSAAMHASARGHRVVLFEKSGKLGGQLALAGAAPHREGWLDFRDAMIRAVRRQPNIDIRLRANVRPEHLKKEKIDALIVATGSYPIIPKIPGAEFSHVTTSRQVLADDKLLNGRVVVIGGGCAGMQTAEYAAARGHNVTVVEMTKDVATDMPSDEKVLMMKRLEGLNVRILTETKARDITKSSVTVSSKKGSQTLQANTAVICLGSLPIGVDMKAMKKAVKKIDVVGDAKEPRRVTEAVAEGMLAAVRLG